MAIHRFDPKNLRKIASNIEKNEPKYRYTIKDHQLISEQDARMLSSPIIEQAQFIAHFGLIHSIKIQLKRNVRPDDAFLPNLLNWIASLEKLRSVFIGGLSAYPERLGRLPYWDDGHYLDKKIFPKKAISKNFLSFSNDLMKNISRNHNACAFMEFQYLFYYYPDFRTFLFHTSFIKKIIQSKIASKEII